MIQYSQRQVFKMMKSGAVENLKDVISTNHLPYGKSLCEKKLEKYLIRIFKKHSKKILSHLAQMEVIAPINLSILLLHQRHPKCIIILYQKALTFALLQPFTKKHLPVLFDRCKSCNWLIFGKNQP